ncbi:glycosyltransferase [Capnocytophaga leadbetteri]|jgi:glycosyltransferase, family 1|uniref:glycosyltransferase n=1 Tax=Capnocytophaga leadbetteri TaxID=327575 RepID=UPI0028D21EA7|nr:glycosyltransferase [Capnocytophaga leadbetteri]
MVNIGFIHGQFPFGGGEMVTSTIAPLLRAMGYNIFVFSSHIHHQQLNDEDKKNITFIDIGKTRLFSSPKVSLAEKANELKIDILVFIGKSFSATRERIFEKTNCKCIFAHYGATFWQAENHLETLQKKAKKSPLHYLFYKGLKIPAFHIYKKIKIEKYRVIYNKYDAFTVLCEAYKDELSKALQLTDNHKIRAISTPVAPATHTYSLEKERLVIYVGRMSYADKRVDRLVTIWESIYKKYPDWQFVLIGSGKELPALQAMVKEKKLERITFLGKVEDTFPYYNKAAIFCLSSQMEGQGTVLMEAQQAGVIPIAFDCSAGVRGILSPNGENGILIPPFDMQAYTNELGKLMSDASTRAHIQKNILIKAEEYSVDVIVKQWDELFKSVL